MHPIAFADILIKGGLGVRSGMNFTRLEGKWYRPEEVFGADKHGWPGDWEGRLILGLSLLTQSTHRAAAYLDEIVSMLPEHLNVNGYVGTVLPDGQFDEQQMAGHSWLIRGLIEYDRLKRGPSIRPMIEAIVTNLLLKAAGYYRSYPIDPAADRRAQNAWILSRLQTKSSSHAETSDAGCAFIMLDGATAAYDYLGWPALDGLIREMIARFAEMDLEALHIQTHATLSACRGILRFYEATGERQFLEIARSVFGLYRAKAWTEAYGNYNWFGLPRWTEPCAIIDSFLVSVGLWKATGDPGYLEDAHLIYFNAICHAQRAGGGFGTDRCVGAAQAEANQLLAPLTYDVYWCCNMRGGEGLSRAIQFNFFHQGDTVTVPFYNDCTAVLRFVDGTLTLEEKAAYPFEGKALLEVLAAEAGSAKTIRLFVPSWAEPGQTSVTLNGKRMDPETSDGFVSVSAVFAAGDKIEIRFGLSVRAEETRMLNSVQGFHKFLYGPMLLGHGQRAQDSADDLILLPVDAKFEPCGRGRFRLQGGDVMLECMCDVSRPTEEESARQVLFRGSLK